MMNHLPDITPEYRWKNEMLEETRKIRMLLEKLVGHNAQVPNQQPEHKQNAQKRQYQRRGAQ
jgi:hypothetical protein